MLIQNRISIKKRSLTERMDLAFLVMIRYASVLFRACILALPVCFLPILFLYMEMFSGSITEIDGEDAVALFLGVVGVIFVLEPLVTAPVTLVLGQIMFEGRPSWGKVVREFCESLPQLLYYRFLWRFTTWRWAFCSEVILLERNPWMGRRVLEDKKKISHVINTTERCKSMALGDPIGADREIKVAFFSFMLFISLSAGIFSLRYFILDINWRLSYAVLIMFYMQIILWSLFFYRTVVRFLSYLDQRIRTEGWDLDLTLRAEVERIDLKENISRNSALHVVESGGHKNAIHDEVTDAVSSLSNLGRMTDPDVSREMDILTDNLAVHGMKNNDSQEESVL